MIRRLLAASALAVCAAGSMPARAASGLEVAVDQSQLMLGDVLTAEFIAKSGDVGQGRFAPPAFDGFEVLSRNQRSEMQIINRDVSRTFVYQFALRARRTGKITIAPAKYTDKQGSVASRPITVRVIEATAPTAPEPGAGGGPKLGNASISLVAEVEPPAAVVGQQVHLTYRLYTRRSLTEYALQDPDLSGFWAEDLTPGRPPRFRRVTIDGKEYDTAAIKRYLLFPLAPGKIAIPPAQVEVAVSTGAFGMRTRKSRRRSNALALEVLPHPPGAPSGFTGAVGRFELAAKLDRTETKVGEPVAMRIELSGTGNLKHFSLPEPEIGEDFRAHPPSVETEVAIQRGRMVGSKSMDLILTPARAGRIRLPSLTVAWYDPVAGEYTEARTAPLAVHVNESEVAGRVLALGVGPARLPEAIQAPDLRPLRTKPTLDPERGRPTPPHRNWPLWLVLLFPPLGIAGLRVSDRLRARRKERQDILVMRKAHRRAKRRLADARDYLRDGRAAEFYGEVARALVGYLQDRISARLAGLTIDELAAALHIAEYPPQAVERVVQELENCDLARFAAAGASEEEMAATHGRVRSLLSDLDHHIPLALEGSA